MPDGSPRNVQGNFMDSSAFPTTFTQRFQESHDISRSMDGSDSSYPNALDSSQTIAITQSLDSNSQMFHWAPLYNSQNAFSNASEHVCGQQPLLGNAPHVISSDVSAASPTQWLSSSTPGFPFHNSLTGELLEVNEAAATSNNVPIGTQESNTTQIDCLTPPTSNGQSSPAKSFGSIARTSSPISEFSAKDTSATSIESASQGSETHICRWQLTGGQICGKQFSSHGQLHDHVDDAHFNNLKTTGDHGLICRWEGCDRFTNDKYTSKRGFDTKSKLRRHMEIHTGPSKLLCLY